MNGFGNARLLSRAAAAAGDGDALFGRRFSFLSFPHPSPVMVLRSLTLSVTRPTLRALASTTASASAADLARLAPHEQIPFAVAPTPRVAGQVDLPDMKAIEPGYEAHETLIVSLGMGSPGWGCGRCGAHRSRGRGGRCTRRSRRLGDVDSLWESRSVRQPVRALHRRRLLHVARPLVSGIVAARSRNLR